MEASKKPPNLGGEQPLFAPVTEDLGKDGRDGIQGATSKLAELLASEGAARVKDKYRECDNFIRRNS